MLEAEDSASNMRKLQGRLCSLLPRLFQQRMQKRIVEKRKAATKKPGVSYAISNEHQDPSNTDTIKTNNNKTENIVRQVREMVS